MIFDHAQTTDDGNQNVNSNLTTFLSFPISVFKIFRYFYIFLVTKLKKLKYFHINLVINLDWSLESYKTYSKSSYSSRSQNYETMKLEKIHKNYNYHKILDKYHNNQV